MWSKNAGAAAASVRQIITPAEYDAKEVKFEKKCFYI
jgi:hypothetical protein